MLITLTVHIKDGTSFGITSAVGAWRSFTHFDRCLDISFKVEWHLQRNPQRNYGDGVANLALSPLYLLKQASILMSSKHRMLIRSGHRLGCYSIREIDI